MITVRSRTDDGPYFRPICYKYQCNTLRDVIFHARAAMEGKEEWIGVFDGEACKGAWYLDWDAEPDGEGGMERAGEHYVFKRASERNDLLLSGQF